MYVDEIYLTWATARQDVTPNCEDLDLSQHLHDALNSLKIVLAAEESLKTGRTLEL